MQHNSIQETTTRNTHMHGYTQHTLRIASYVAQIDADLLICIYGEMLVRWSMFLVCTTKTCL